MESTPGKVSTFRFTAIVEQSNQKTVSTDKYDEQQQPTGSRKPAADLLILVAEDNHINQKVVRRLLDPLDCRVDMVENGLDAIAAVTRTPYDLVLMDVQMPKMDGPTATAKIRSLPDPVGAIPVIALTANAVHGDRKRYLAMGMTDSFHSPSIIWRYTAQSLAAPTQPCSKSRNPRSPGCRITTARHYRRKPPLPSMI